MTGAVVNDRLCGQCPRTIRARCIACRYFPVLLRCPAKASPVEAGLLSADRCHSLRSLLPPPAALPSLPRSVRYCSSSKPPLEGRCRRSRRMGGNFHICSPLSLFSAEAEKIQLPSEGSLGPLNDHLPPQERTGQGKALTTSKSLGAHCLRRLAAKRSFIAAET